MGGRHGFDMLLKPHHFQYVRLWQAIRNKGWFF
jgi:hypothetical protein